MKDEDDLDDVTEPSVGLVLLFDVESACVDRDSFSIATDEWMLAEPLELCEAAKPSSWVVIRRVR